MHGWQQKMVNFGVIHLDRKISNIWAKTGQNNKFIWHPLILHMLDVAASADAILFREPENTRKQMARGLGLEWKNARPWLLTIIACHDLGKACPGFQSKWPEAPPTGLKMPRCPNTQVNHAYVSQIALTELLQEKNWTLELADLVADAVGCHHGERATPLTINQLTGDRSAIGCKEWEQARRDLFDHLLDVFHQEKVSDKKSLSGPEFMLLSGLTSFADWIGSNEEWFPFGTPENCDDLSIWFEERRECADQALDAIGWNHRTPLAPESVSFEQAFGFSPRPLQQTVVDALGTLKSPAVLLVEAPMGEGKTEAAFFAHLELQRRFGHRGLYVALPTKATGNAMFTRTLNFLNYQGTGRNLDLQLLHGATLLNNVFQNLRLSEVHDSLTNSDIRAGEWFTHKKRALLSEYGVGTVDQALLPILPVRHNFVRLWGLANRVVVFDEIHAYDAYTGTLLIYLLRWLVALGSSIVLLSATLPPSIRRKLAEELGGELPETEVEYPRLSVFQQTCVEQIHFKSDPARRRKIQLSGIKPDLSAIYANLESHLAGGGMGLALVNTVQRAQELYLFFPKGEALMREGLCIGKRLSDGTEVNLFHARFPSDQRQQCENNALESYQGNNSRSGRKILIATQVAEQSLDLDFDLIVTDLAPIDLLLQRAGRLWRHKREGRPIREPILIIAGIADDQPPSFGKPLWWNCVYPENLLLSTWSLLRNREALVLPDEIDRLVQAVYEEQVLVPDSIQEWLDNALMDAEGVTYAQRIQATQAIIGFPDDGSWNDSTRFVLFDENEPGVHRTLLAKTRLGEDSVVVIPLSHDNGFDYKLTPDFGQSKLWYQRAVSLSRKNVVKKNQQNGVPEGWRQSSLLCNCYPLLLDKNGLWIEDPKVRLDDELGIVYETKEAE